MSSKSIIPSESAMKIQKGKQIILAGLIRTGIIKKGGIRAAIEGQAKYQWY